MKSHTRKLAEFETRCQVAGLTLTLQRRAVFEALAAREDHPTADDVAADVAERHRGVSRATVYRALEAFVQHGLVTKVGHCAVAVRYDAKVGRHHHMICDRCGSIRDLEDAGLDTLPVPDVDTIGFRARDYSVHLRGLCANCDKADGAQL